MTDAIVGLLDPKSTSQVQDLWSDLERHCGLVDVSRRVPWPHVSFHVAERYNWSEVEERVARLAGSTTEIPLVSDAFGLFTGVGAVFPAIVRVVPRSPELSALRDRIEHEVDQFSEGVSSYCRELVWLPHITIASRDVSLKMLGAAMMALADERPLALSGFIDRLALIEDRSGDHVLLASHQLTTTRNDSI